MDSGDDGVATDARQLAAIGELGTAFDASGLDHWLFGGWAVDFLVGRRTRPHDDVDLAVWRRDRPRIHGCLVSAGWQHTPLEGEIEGTRYARDGVRLELTFLVDGDEGEVFIPFEPEPALWSAEPFGNETKVLGGVCARIVPLGRMLADKERARADPAEGSKDRADLESLQSVWGDPGR
ncbi:nucleotidyltransferase domain-containing protein [Intrasporangium sp. YIM S08009]|uniref:nucleotidyltransferase domain-containing protein n=1 Tax=Intrasporangium zincisolvens TaxID=3080018 RepID=UPI002B056F08|nr:hypothetical protein [Intrasporangium sp. YIM S08009]